MICLGNPMVGLAQTITVAPSNQPPYCGQEIITLIASGVPCGPGSPAQWSISNGTQTSGLSPLTDPCQFTAVFGVGCWDVALTINGTTYPTIASVFCVNPFPTASFTVDATNICEGGCIVFTDTSSPAGQIDSRTWTGLPCPEGGAGLATFTCCFPAADTYYPDLTVFSTGCPDAVLDSIPIVVSNTYPTAAFTPTNVLDCPAPLDLDLVNTSTPSSVSSVWVLTSAATGDTACEVMTADLFCSGLDVGDYEACLTVTNADGCSHQVCHPVTIFDQPLLNITVGPSPTCANVPVSFSTAGTLPASPTSVEWNIGCDGTIDGMGQNWNYSFPTAGIYNVCAHVEYSPTCWADTTFTIEVFAPLDAAFTPGDTTVCFEPVNLSFTNQSTGSGILGFSWRVNGTEQGTTMDFNWTFNAPSTVQLVVTNSMGCTATEHHGDRRPAWRSP
ncbi:MAG: PKD domain-containing protein [Flavobacteriales bacterium]|nr:PKD domain-containing protein [Flavobacteriales bacterium]